MHRIYFVVVLNLIFVLIRRETLFCTSKMKKMSLLVWSRKQTSGVRTGMRFSSKPPKSIKGTLLFNLTFIQYQIVIFISFSFVYFEKSIILDPRNSLLSFVYVFCIFTIHRSDVGVFFCGPAVLSHTLHEMSNKHSNDSTKFYYNKENF